MSTIPRAEIKLGETPKEELQCTIPDSQGAIIIALDTLLEPFKKMFTIPDFRLYEFFLIPVDFS